MKPSLRGIAALAFAAAFVAAPAFAKDHGDDKHEEKHEKHEEQAEKHRDHEEVREGAYFSHEHHEAAHRYYAEHYGNGRHCPPGLAKKDNGCMPPGQARKWAVGAPMPRGITVYAVPQPVLVQLPPVPVGYRYSRVGADIVLVRIQSGLVVDIMLNVFG